MGERAKLLKSQKNHRDMGIEKRSTGVSRFKQISVDQSSGQRRKVRLLAFLDEVETTMQASVKRSRHQLFIQCPADIEMDTYPDALFQILSNLINNLLIHAFDDSQNGKISVLAANQNEKLELIVSDNGRGMDAETARRSFDPFFLGRDAAVAAPD